MPARLIWAIAGLGIISASAPSHAQELGPDDEVIVIEADDAGTPEAGTASGRVVDADDIERTPRRSADDLLRLVPGLHISQHGSEGKAQQFFLRGFDAVHGSDLEVVVGGAVINEPSNVHGHGYVDIGFVVPEVVSSMHAHKGSFSLSQGPFGTAGTVELELGVAPQHRGHRLGYELGSTNRHRVLALSAPIDLPEQSFMALEAMSDDGFGQNRAARRLVGIAQHRFTLGGAESSPASLDVFAVAHAGRFGEPGTLPVAGVEAGRFDFYDAASTGTGGSSRRLLAGLRLAGDLDAGRWRVDASAGRRQLDLAENFTGFLFDAEMGDARGQRHDATTAAASARVELDLGRDLRAAGARVTAVVAGGARVDRIDQSEDALDPDGRPLMRTRDLAADQLAGDLAAGLRLERGRARVELGARLDAVRIDAEDRLASMTAESTGTVADTAAQLSPRVASSLRLSDGVSLFAAYGRGLRPPEARQAIAGGAEITASDAVEIGSRLQLGHRVSIGAAAFAVWIDRELVFDHASGTNLARGATRRAGGELDVEIDAADWLSLRADLTATDARFVDSGEPVPYAPRLLGTAEARLRSASGFSAGAQLTAVAPRPLAHGATGEAVAVVNALGSYRMRWIELGLQIDNLFDARWREGEYRYASRFDPTRPASQLPQTHFAAGRPLGARVSITSWF